MRACNCARASPLQSRTCEGGDIAAAIMSEAGLPFQSTHPRGVRPCGRRKKHVWTMFQSTHPRGVRRQKTFWPPQPCCSFNPRTRVGGDVTVLRGYAIINKFQSTHPRGVRPALFADGHVAVMVSIHAPAWGATPLAFTSLGIFLVSIHAPAWGATKGRQRCSRSRYVSIHAPAWGATASSCAAVPTASCFNPRTRVGCDSHTKLLAMATMCFNPRTRVGCDSDFRVDSVYTLPVSIHAPAWGAT